MLDPRVALAAERTLLSWTRTGLGVMGLGAALLHLPDASLRKGIPWGIGVVVLGLCAPLLGAFRYRRQMKRLNQGLELPPDDPVVASLFAVAIALAAGALALWSVLGPGGR
ncbi:MAG: DUF202 domain-containing protein [Polyangiaceae bacterium]|nr:DUF202 domain-containing protein [Polyangiaceae bacterium]